jgi:GTP cyclohydrolase II
MMNIFLHKIETPLEEQLKEAIEAKTIRDIYEPPELRRKGESTEKYIQRLITASTQYQFVKVQNDYVAFGTAGPIICDDGVFFMVPAEIVGGTWGIHNVLVYPNLGATLEKEEVLLRIDSGCYSGAVLGDITCDCVQQLRKSQKEIIANGSGLIVVVPGHDGRGWKEYKMANQQLMHELNMTTTEAAQAFYGHETEIDRRTYNEVATVLQAMGFGPRHSFVLASNNQKKIAAIRDAGLNVSDTIEVVADDLEGIAKRNFESKQSLWGKGPK